MTLLKRILVEKRAVLVPLVVGLLVNIGVYSLVLYPLKVRSASAADRAAGAAQSVLTADDDVKKARALVTGKSNADQQLTTFHQTVLPANESEARRKTYLRIPTLAGKAHVRVISRSTEHDPTAVRTTHLGLLRTRVVLTGEYEGLRQFVYELETSPEFIIIDSVSIAQVEASKPLTLTVNLSTYYQLGADGS